MTDFQDNRAPDCGANHPDVPSAFAIAGSVNRSALPAARSALTSWLRQADPRVEATGRIVLRNLNWLEREPWRPGLLAMTAANVARLQQAINGS